MHLKMIKADPGVGDDFSQAGSTSGTKHAKTQRVPMIHPS